MSINIEAEKRAYKHFVAAGMTPAGACGLIGNLEAESDGFWCNRLEYLCVKRLKERGKVYTDTSYTAAVDSGKISCEEFLHPIPGKQYGYGLAQVDNPGSQVWIVHAGETERGSRLRTRTAQLDYVLYELEHVFPSVLKVLKTGSQYSDSIGYRTTKI
ncbi:phage tail tip lysozyme [Lawsonibacter sp. OA9]|uniref:phage tail tip lysozyme n=1 Tax=Lawsonibacter sp. OA9 TaxID=2914163 RepID=UPI001F06D8FA|nr:phage tail tip lysozyme [Lawsonibacter sp. OA9]MCH1978242.1 phage tail tip lysozyme [Lawsonibacter sp. OA9]